MPVYQCKPGSKSKKPWSHGVPVYALPFPFDSKRANGINVTRTEESNLETTQTPTTVDNRVNENNTDDTNSNTDNINEAQDQMHQYEDDDTRYITHNLADGNAARDLSDPSATTALQRAPIRRVKHSEIVLVDEIGIYYGNFWLRLRWPGKRGGVAGYIALGGTNIVPIESVIPNRPVQELKEKANASGEDRLVILSENLRENTYKNNKNMVCDTTEDDDVLSSEQKHTMENIQSYNSSENEQSLPEEVGDDMGSIDPPATAPFTEELDLHKAKNSICESTGLYFPSTAAMELLALYDDGLSSSPQDSLIDDSDTGSNGLEPVFCRICREGLHDIDYDFEADDEKDNAENDVVVNENIIPEQLPHSLPIRRLARLNTDRSQSGSQNEMPLNHLLNEALNQQATANVIETEGNDPNNSTGQSKTIKSNSALAHIKPAEINHPYAENPLLAPCECSGSMAFVHYLCIEQWRCRSHHPAAKNGLNCETCKAPYTLPPPPSRPEHQEEDWLEAMPPWVLGALRNPHPFWRIGAAIVRRRWLRPIAPILTSPIVALYCRARRSLKKRGVSRRRWSCSLCRRRARWKCVRCLRSYYCSRQCQNVSWHIVHKHVCYKPSRYWWSVVVYGLAYVYFIPGVLSYPYVHDLGLGFLWLCFNLNGFICGTFATLMKREMGIDIRGRCLEFFVAVQTIWTGLVSLGLIWGFFGEPNQCLGLMDRMGFTWTLPSLKMFLSTQDEFPFSPEQNLVRNLILKPTQTFINTADKGFLMTGPFLTKWICSADDSAINEEMHSCLEMTRKVNPDFMSPEHNGHTCSSDFHLLTNLVYFAFFIHVLCTVWKRRERGRRVLLRRVLFRHQRLIPRPHQD